eukprot:PhF_6_TR29178/c1_g1_i1/m.42671
MQQGMNDEDLELQRQRHEFYQFYLRQRAMQQQQQQQQSSSPLVPHNAPPHPEEEAILHQQPIPVPQQPVRTNRPRFQNAQALFWTLFKCAALSAILARGFNFRAFVFFVLFSGARLLQYVSGFIKTERLPRADGLGGQNTKEWPVVVRLAALYFFSLFPSWRIETLDD